MECPHCRKEFFSSTTNIGFKDDCECRWFVEAECCPACGRAIIHLQGTANDCPLWNKRYLVYPRAVARIGLSPDVPEKFAGDYREACLVLNDSPKASAALSRRCLQHVLQEEGKVTKKNLAQQIDEVLPTLPRHLREMIDGVRNLGNLAAHPIKSTNTGEILDVEPGEAEWLLDTLEMLFDFYFVQPGESQRKRDAINRKLSDAGKPPMK